MKTWMKLLFHRIYIPKRRLTNVRSEIKSIKSIKVEPGENQEINDIKFSLNKQYFKGMKKDVVS